MRSAVAGRWLRGVAAALGLALSASPALAVSSKDAPGIAQRSLSDAEREFDTVRKAIQDARNTRRTPEQRLADSETLLRNRDYPRAITSLHEIIEKHADHPTVVPDALSMLGEAYYQSRQLLSARRVFRQIIDRSGESRMATYVPRAYVRLVDIALRTQNTKDLDDLLARLGAASGEPTLAYARAKGLVSKKDFAGARSSASSVPSGHLLHHQARYLLGVVAMREAQAQAPQVKLSPGQQAPSVPPARYAAAIEAFRQVTQLPPDTPEHRHVIDLAWMAIGRLFYEADQWNDAASAYGHVDRTSPEFGASLYELAWVYVRLNDTSRATQALEILSIVDPSNTYQADGSLLRADLLLRAGEFKKALDLYEGVRKDYDPMREKVDTFLRSTSDPAVYYDKLANLEGVETIDGATVLPPLATQWAREAQDGPAAFALLDDLGQSRELLRQSQSMVAKLRAVLAAPNRVKAFPELKAGDERSLMLLNRITQTRGILAAGLDDAEPGEVSGELAIVRQERRALQQRLKQLPLTDGDLGDRDAAAERQWNRVSQSLQQLQLQIDQIQAISNSLKNLLNRSTAKDPGQVKMWQDELAANERDLKTYRDQIGQLRKQIEYGRLQVGYGDQRFVEDDQLRAAFREKLGRELQLVAGGAAGGDATEYASRAQPVMGQAATDEDKLIAIRRELQAEVDKKTAEIDLVIQKEAAAVLSLASRLDSLDQEARLVIGQVAMRNFTLVRDKLRSIVLRADVGASQQAWAVREEQMFRVNMLRRERDREEKMLQDELKEVLDDSSDPASGTPLRRMLLMNGYVRPGASTRHLRSILSFGVVLAMALGVSVDAASQQQPKAAAKAPAKAPAKGPKGGKPAASASASSGIPEPVSSADFVPTPVSTATSPLPTSSAIRKAAPPPPMPSDDQLKGLDQLRSEVESFERDGREFRDAVSAAVKHHYEARRQRTLGVLDRSISRESKKLIEARLEAIRRFESFIATYSGPAAHPEHTPDAMFRLAALYEEYSATLADTAQQNAEQKKAIALYKRIIREFPDYKERAAIFYYLGHALNNVGRQPEAQQIWRSLVCSNHYSYPVATDPTDPDRDLIQKKEQDHAESYWTAWGTMHPTPVGLGKAKADAKKPGKAAPKAAKAKPDPKRVKKEGKSAQEEPASSEDETAYTEIYPADCTSIPQKPEPGRDPRYLSEVWWQIGDFHFDQGDVKAGPYNFNRAVSAYTRSMASVSKENQLKSAVFGVALYKLAWTYYKQQRYEQAVRTFVDLLKYTDELEKTTGDPGTDFRKEASDYIAGSVTFVDFVGPAGDEPFIVRPDIVLDSGLPASEQEKKMRVGLERLQDDKLVPQDRKWTFGVYRALAKEYHELGQLANETATLEVLLKKFPMHPDAPVVQDELAQVYDRRAQFAQTLNSPEAAEFAAKALEARTGLADYVVSEDGKLKPWVEANKDNPEAIQRAERLVKNGLKNAAAQHTINAREAVNESAQSTDPERQRTALRRGLKEYELAEKGWEAYLSQVRNTREEYESAFWVADSRFNQVNLTIALGQSVPPEKYASAHQAAVDVRDSNENDKFLEPSAQYVVALTDLALKEQYTLFGSSNGSQGVKEKTNLVFAGEGKEIKVDRNPPPAPVLATIAARDEYISRVPPTNQVAIDNGRLYQYQSAENYFVYGQFDEAKKRLEQVVKDQCKKSKWAFEAQKRLLTIYRIEGDLAGDPERVKPIAKAIEDPEQSCATSKEEFEKAKQVATGILQGGFFQIAYSAFEKACMADPNDKDKKCKPASADESPERRKQWRLAAELYEAALKEAPERPEAPEAAINGAYAYKQIGEYDKAIEMYRLFIDKYGDDKILDPLQKGDEKQRAEYAKRVENLNIAYSSLSEAYVLFFNYVAAAETYEKISSIGRFDEAKRKDSARNALVLYVNLGDQAKMEAMRTRFLSFKPSAEDKAEADYLVASADLKRWDERGDSEPNRAARQKAIGSLTGFYDKNKNNKAAGQYNVNAAYWVAKMRNSAGDKVADDWWKNTIAAYNAYRATKGDKVKGSLEATMAAESDFTLQDAEIRKNFDYESGHHRYKGTAVDVVKKYQADAKDAQKYYDKLERVASLDKSKNAYDSSEFIVAGMARQGSLYDSLRTGLFNTREPALVMFTPQQEAALRKFEESGQDELVEKAMVLRESVTQAWRKKRDEELKAADQNMVFKYTLATVLARNYNIRSPAIKKALQRLAFFTDLLGDPKMQEYTAPVEKNEELKFKYESGMFQKTRPGMVAEPEVSVAPPPLPVLVK